MTSAAARAAAGEETEGGTEVDTVDRRPSAPGRPDAGERYLAVHVALAAVVGAVCTAVWTATGHGYFWPVWVWLGVATGVVVHLGAVRVAAAAPGARRSFVLHVWATAALAALVVLVWLLTTPGAAWIRWPLLGLAAALAAHAAVRFLRPDVSRRELELTDRVAELTRSRRGAVDLQATELRRIERDLHDGAQSRLVALSLQLGRARTAIAGHPQAASLAGLAALVDGAHEHADAAIAELRDLVAGIAPPILTDRGLVEAVAALARRAGVAVDVHADVPARPPFAVELAAYFVVSEAVTNAVKHARVAGRPLLVDVRLRSTHDRLRVRIADDGPGGADPAGSGLTGLAQRAAALDGTFVVGDAPGGGTVVEAVLPLGPSR